MFSLKCLFLFIILFPNMTEIQVNVMKMAFIKEESEDVKIEEERSESNMKILIHKQVCINSRSWTQ